jgi:hypothetical protein
VWGDTTKLYDSGVLRGTTATALVNVTLTGRTELRLVVTTAADGNFFDHGDWADARITCGTTPDTTPPTVTTVSPSAGATGVARNVNVTATFSEPMQAATITTATVTLVRAGTTTPVSAVVTFSAATRVLTLNPNSNLAANALYTARIIGGSSGVKDAAGNALASDRVWTFTTQ